MRHARLPCPESAISKSLIGTYGIAGYEGFYGEGVDYLPCQMMSVESLFPGQSDKWRADTHLMHRLSTFTFAIRHLET